MEGFIKWRRLKAVGDLTLGARPGDWGMEQRRMLSDAHVVYGVRYMVHTAISRKVVGKTVHATIPKGNMGYDQS